MSNRRPESIAIDPDDYHAEHVGWTREKQQFFLTTPFEPRIDEKAKGCEYVALFIFDAEGNLIEAKIDEFGPRKSIDSQSLRNCYDLRLRELGDVSKERIVVKPFAIERFNTTFLVSCRANRRIATMNGRLSFNQVTTWHFLNHGTAVSMTHKSSIEPKSYLKFYRLILEAVKYLGVMNRPECPDLSNGEYHPRY
jgi:hypothetical protein